MNRDIYKKILDHMAEAVWMGDEDEKTIYANEQFLKLVGYSLEEIIGKESYIFWDKKSSEKVRKENTTKRKAGESSSYKGNLVSKSGDIIPVKLNGTALGGGGTIGIMTDMRDLYAKVNSEKILFNAVDQSNDGVILCNQNGDILLWNQGAQMIFGYKKNIIGKNISILFEDDIYQEIIQTKQPIKKYQIDGISINKEKLYLSITQSFIRQDNNDIFYLLSCRDISSFQKIENEIALKQQKIQDVYTELGIRKRQLDYTYELIEVARKHKNDTKKICNFIIASMVMLSGADGCEILLMDKAQKNLDIISHMGFSDEWNGRKSFPFEGSLTQLAVKQGYNLKVYDLKSNPFYTRKQLARKNGLSAGLIIPLYKNSHEVFGTLALYAHFEKQIDVFDNDFIEKYAKVVEMVLT